MRSIGHILLSAMLLTIASAVMPILPSTAIMPCVVVPIIVFLALSHSLLYTLLLTIPIGYLTDRYCLAPSGFHIVLLSWVAVQVRVISSLFNLNDKSAAVVLSFFSQALVTWLGYIFLYVLTGQVGFQSWLHVIQLPAMLICAMLTLFTWPLQKWMERPDKNSEVRLLGGNRT